MCVRSRSRYLIGICRHAVRYSLRYMNLAILLFSIVSYIALLKYSCSFSHLEAASATDFADGLVHGQGGSDNCMGATPITALDHSERAFFLIVLLE